MAIVDMKKKCMRNLKQKTRSLFKFPMSSTECIQILIIVPDLLLVGKYGMKIAFH